jgi:hypothetical protein
MRAHAPTCRRYAERVGMMESVDGLLLLSTFVDGVISASSQPAFNELLRIHSAKTLRECHLPARMPPAAALRIHNDAGAFSDNLNGIVSSLKPDT